jgi:hypothetical protein
MARAVVTRKTLDTLLRAKIATLPACASVEALPVARRPGGAGCNWSAPGFVGEADAVRKCVEEIEGYVAILQAQFNLPPQGEEIPGE